MNFLFLLQQIRTPTNHSPPVRIITPINPNSTATPPYAAPVMPSIGTNSSLSFPTTRTTPAPPSTQSKMPSVSVSLYPPYVFPFPIPYPHLFLVN